MSDVGQLVERINAAFTASADRLQQLKTQQVAAFQGHRQRLEQFEQIVSGLRSLWRSRLEALAVKFGDRVEVRPQSEPGQHWATFHFQSELALIELRFSMAADSNVEHVIFTYDLRIIPILMQFDSHSEITFSLKAVDNTEFASWIDDRIVSFVHTYLSLHENQYYLRDHMVEDPVAKVKFPKHAAEAICEVDGRTYYFIGEATLREFRNRLNNVERGRTDPSEGQP